jgi:aminocarboxymuconate-semialdehyde decarboxylase
MFADTITHDAAALRFLVERVGAENIAMGTDLPFDMATPRPVAALEEAVEPEAARRIMEETPRRLFRL